MSRRGPGEGSIYERWDGRWAGSVHIGYEDGRRVRRHVMGRTRAEVKDKLAARMRAHDELRPVASQREKVGPFLRRWLDEVAKPNLRASTYESYDDIVRLHLIKGLGQIPLAKSLRRRSRRFWIASSPLGSHRAGSDTSTPSSAVRWGPQSDGVWSRATWASSSTRLVSPSTRSTR